ncbi:hypothetical protein [Algoriphagus namhaensis]
MLQFQDGPAFHSDPKVSKAAINFKNLLQAISEKTIPEPIERAIQAQVQEVNQAMGSPKELRKRISSARDKILALLEKELKMVPIGHYQSQWMAVGMAAFGIPLGAAFGTALGNMAFLGLGLPIGMIIGMTIGITKDSTAKKDGLQLQYKKHL